MCAKIHKSFNGNPYMKLDPLKNQKENTTYKQQHSTSYLRGIRFIIKTSNPNVSRRTAARLAMSSNDLIIPLSHTYVI